MSQDQKNTSFSLLTQKEIDTLIDFLTANKGNMESKTLSQKSIDKLIMLIQTDKERLALNYILNFGYLEPSLLEKLNFRSDPSEMCELRFSINEATSYIELTVYNQVTEKTLSLTPSVLNETDTDEWGRSMPPTMFNHIAASLSLKYSKETYDTVCSVFAEQQFGDANHKIPEIYLLDNESLVDWLL